MAALETLTARGVGSGEQWAALASRAGRAGRLDVASAILDSGRLRFPESTALHYNSAVVSALQNQPEKAAEQFRRVLAIDPEHREARENLAGMLASLGRYDEAIAHYRDAVTRSPQDPELRILLARALHGRGSQVEAMAEMDRALALAPGNGAATIAARNMDAGRQPRGGST